MNNEKINQVKENIRTINPLVTDELLDLLYEYFQLRQYDAYERRMLSLKDNPELSKLLSHAIMHQLVDK